MVYHIVYILFRLLSVLPFRVLFWLSDLFYLIIYKVIGYRVDVVRKNLQSSFPEKTIKERRQIERDFYHWLCDYFFETIKLLDMSHEEMLSHIEFRGAEQIEQCIAEGQSVAVMLGHYCNWEYLSAAKLMWKNCPDTVVGLIYHPLRNKVMDRIFFELRSRMGGTCIPKNDILRYLVKYSKEKKSTAFGYISDQSPKWENIHLWVDFLNQKTPVFTGAERIARKMKDAVFYVDMDRVARGKYVCTYKPITREPEKMEEFELTREVFRQLEETIRRRPHLYLWSHNRWKRTYEEYLQRQNKE